MVCYSLLFYLQRFIFYILFFFLFFATFSHLLSCVPPPLPRQHILTLFQPPPLATRVLNLSIGPLPISITVVRFFIFFSYNLFIYYSFYFNLILHWFTEKFNWHILTSKKPYTQIQTLYNWKMIGPNGTKT